MFLKKKEKNPNFTKKQEWKWELAGAQVRPAIKNNSNLIYTTPGIQIKDPSRTLSIGVDKSNNSISYGEPKVFKFEKKRNRGFLKRLGDKLFGDW